MGSKGEMRILLRRKRDEDLVMKEERRGFGYEGRETRIWLCRERDEDLVMKGERRGFGYEGREARILL